MKAAINIQPLLRQNKSGIGFYEYEMIKALLSSGSDIEYILNCFDHQNENEEYIRSLSGGIAKEEVCAWFNHSLYQILWTFFHVPYKWFFSSHPDVSAFFNFYLPPSVRGKKVLVIYDTVIKDHPETMRFKTRLMLSLTLSKSIKRADRIITISEFSKSRIIKHYGVNEDSITVIPCAADREKFFPMRDRRELIEKVKEKYKIEDKYFLYIGTLEPRKNILRLLEAYFMASNQVPDLPRLVLGGGKGWMYKDIFDKTEELGLKDKVVFTGYVDEKDVPVLMNGAQAFCFPSLYEGFGMPPLEAMSCGTPVIVSDCTSLPEVVGECGIKVDPYSVNDISKALITMCNDDFVQKQRKMCLRQAEHFSWQDSAAKLEKVFKELSDE